MARQINEFTFAWESLSGTIDQSGWRSISVFSPSSCNIMAARRFPGNEESVLINFPDVKIPLAEKLPEGRGFIVERVDPNDDGKTWLALTRRESGNVDLFAIMVCDIVGAMDKEASNEVPRLLRIFLSRVRSWQEFMRKGAQTLGAEEEIGLVGELFFLQSFIKMGAPPLTIVESWVGPLDGVQDFEIGTGAVEIKATISSAGFLARIGSLEQLDDSLRQPLFLAGVQFTQAETGLNLPEFVDAAYQVINSDAEAERIFSERLFAAGYLDAHANRYSRRFTMASTRVLEVVGGFPRITHGTVPIGIKRVIYDIDLDRVPGENLGLSEILIRLGAL